MELKEDLPALIPHVWTIFIKIHTKKTINLDYIMVILQTPYQYQALSKKLSLIKFIT